MPRASRYTVPMHEGSEGMWLRPGASWSQAPYAATGVTGTWSPLHSTLVMRTTPVIVNKGLAPVVSVLSYVNQVHWCADGFMICQSWNKIFILIRLSVVGHSIGQLGFEVLLFARAEDLDYVFWRLGANFGGWKGDFLGGKGFDFLEVRGQTWRRGTWRAGTASHACLLQHSTWIVLEMLQRSIVSSWMVLKMLQRSTWIVLKMLQRSLVSSWMVL